MTTRHLIAYGLIAVLASAGILALWFGVMRERFAWRRRSRRAARERRDALAARRPAHQTD